MPTAGTDDAKRSASAVIASDAVDELTRVAAHAKVLVDTADQLVNEAVQRCKAWGCRWDEIGRTLGISKQAAQQRFAQPDHSSFNSGGQSMIDQLRALVDGSPRQLRDVPRATGGAAGVFTIWYRDNLLYLGHSRQSADEAKVSNRHEADGARGRLVGVRRQPTRSLQRVFERNFVSDLEAAPGTSGAKRTESLLKQHGEYRLVETANGRDAVRLYEAAVDWLPSNGYRILAVE